MEKSYRERDEKNPKLEGKLFASLSGTDQNRVLMEVIDSAGRSRPKVTADPESCAGRVEGSGWRRC